MNEAYLCPCLFVIYIPAGPRYIRWRGKNLHYSTFTEDNHCWHIAHREPTLDILMKTWSETVDDCLVVSPARQKREIDEGVGAGGRRMEGGGGWGEGGEGKKAPQTFVYGNIWYKDSKLDYGINAKIKLINVP